MNRDSLSFTFPEIHGTLAIGYDQQITAPALNHSNFQQDANFSGGLAGYFKDCRQCGMYVPTRPFGGGSWDNARFAPHPGLIERVHHRMPRVFGLIQPWRCSLFPLPLAVSTLRSRDLFSREVRRAGHSPRFVPARGRKYNWRAGPSKDGELSKW